MQCLPAELVEVDREARTERSGDPVDGAVLLARFGEQLDRERRDDAIDSDHREREQQSCLLGGRFDQFENG